MNSADPSLSSSEEDSDDDSVKKHVHQMRHLAKLKAWGDMTGEEREPFMEEANEDEEDNLEIPTTEADWIRLENKYMKMIKTVIRLAGKL